MEVNPGIVLISLMKNLPVDAFQQKIDARHAFAIDSLVTGDGEALHLGRLFRRQIRGNDGLALDSDRYLSS